MKITHTGITMKLDEKERNLIRETIKLLSDIFDEAGGYNKVVGWSCTIEEVANVHDALIDLNLTDNDGRDYDFKSKELVDAV